MPSFSAQLPNLVQVSPVAEVLLSPPQALVHVHPGVDELGRVYRARLAICASPGAFLGALAALPALPAQRWRESARAVRGEVEAWRAPRPVPGDVDLWRIVRWLDERLPVSYSLKAGAFMPLVPWEQAVMPGES